MAYLTTEHLQRILDSRPAGHSVPRILIESGTFEAQTALIAAEFFDWVHTIELSAELYAAAVDKCAGGRNIVCHHGDSAAILPKILAAIDEPVVCYLDAHAFWRGAGALEAKVSHDNPLPLWAELAAIRGRHFKDWVIVDDVHAFNRPACSAPSGAGEPSWEEVNADSILDALGLDRLDKWATIDDQFCVWL